MPRTSSAPQIAADARPSREFASLASRAIEIHIAAGNWACAQNALDKAHADFLAAQSERRSTAARTPAAWLAEPVASLEIASPLHPVPLRVINYLEDAGAISISDALEILGSGRKISNMGPTQTELVWRVARELGIDIARFGYIAPAPTPAPVPAASQTPARRGPPSPALLKSRARWNRGAVDNSLSSNRRQTG